MFAIRKADTLDRTEFRTVRYAERVVAIVAMAAAALAAQLAAEEAARAAIELLAHVPLGSVVPDGSGL